MLTAYINYPNSRISVHHDPSCSTIGQQGKSKQRNLRLDPRTISAHLIEFGNKEHKFASHAAQNDMWLDIDFDDAEFEMAVLRYIHGLLNDHYIPFQHAAIDVHCS